MEKEQRKSLEQALAKVITDWVDFLGKNAGEKMEKPIRAAARELMKKWNKLEKKSSTKENLEDPSHTSAELESFSVPLKKKAATSAKKTKSVAPAASVRQRKSKASPLAAKKSGSAPEMPSVSASRSSVVDAKRRPGRPAKKVERKTK